MILHNIKIALRNIAQFKVQTIISVVGLALGMVCFSMSFLWMVYIHSYEYFVPDAERVYLVGKKGTAVQPEAVYLTADLISEVLSGVPEIESVSKITNTNQSQKSQILTIVEEGQIPVNVNTDADVNKESEESKFDIIEIADNFIDFFGVKVISGNLGNPLKENEIILTESSAKRLFGDEYPIGKSLCVNYRDLMGDERIKTVRAIVADPPDNTQFVYDAMIGHRPTEGPRSYFNSMYNTFIKVHPGISEQQINDKLKDFKFKAGRWDGSGTTFEAAFDYDLMPLRSLRTEYMESDNTVKTQYVKVFVLIGFLVVIFSIVNYLLTTVSLLRSRSRQMAIRRLWGARLRDIVNLNVTEAAVIFIVAAIIGLAGSFLLLPIFKEYAMISASESTLLLGLLTYVVVVVVIGLMITGCTTLVVLRRTQRSIIQGHQIQRSSSKLDKISCVLQLTLSIGMIFATLVMYSQLRYLSQSNALGFKRTDMVGIAWVQDKEELKRHAAALPMVQEYLDSLGFIYPTNISMSSRITLLDKNGSVRHEDHCEVVTLKERQIPFWELEVLEGRMFRDGQPEMMVNQSALEKFGGSDIIGSTLEIPGRTYTIVGVLGNMYTSSPMAEPNPTLYTPDEIMSMEMFDSFLTFKLQPGQKEEFVKAITPLVPQPSNIIDIEQSYNQKLKSEYMLMQLLTAIGICGQLVSIMGAYSMISLTLQERRKEMALRKINGAKRRLIMGLFLKSNLYSLLIASVIAFPTVYIIMHQWLEHYPKHISMPWYLIPVIILALGALITLTVISKVRKASSENPADVLKE